MSSSIGNLFRLTTFGESHGVAVGGIIDGCPSGLSLDFDYIQSCVNKRRPGVEDIFSLRKELDEVEFLSGLFDGVTLGTPIAFLIRNIDHNSKDYASLKDVFRPSHADFTYEKKYGIRDYRGGGRSSARETVNWVVAGSVASQILKQKGITVSSYVSSVGNVHLSDNMKDLDLDLIYKNEVRCPCVETSMKMKKLIKTCQMKGDSVGGCISTVIKGVPFGLGEPVFNKFQAGLSRGIMSINASKGISFGTGFTASTKTGSQENDLFILKSGSISTKTNHSGGVQGGITNGQDVFFHASFKPASTISKKQTTIDNKMNKIELSATGRHDPCVVPRAVSIVESLTAMIVLDYYLLHKTTKLSDL